MEVIHVAINWIVLHWDTILELLGGGAGLSVLLQWVLHKLHVDSKKLAYTSIHLLSVAAALADFYLANGAILPAYAGLVIAAQTIHRFVVSPVYNTKVLPFLDYLAASKASPVNDAVPAPELQAGDQAVPVPAAGFVS